MKTKLKRREEEQKTAESRAKEVVLFSVSEKGLTTEAFWSNLKEKAVNWELTSPETRSIRDWNEAEAATAAKHDTAEDVQNKSQMLLKSWMRQRIKQQSDLQTLHFNVRWCDSGLHRQSSPIRELQVWRREREKDTKFGTKMVREREDRQPVSTDQTGH